MIGEVGRLIIMQVQSELYLELGKYEHEPQSRETFKPSAFSGTTVDVLLLYSALVLQSLVIITIRKFDSKN